MIDLVTLAHIAHIQDTRILVTSCAYAGQCLGTSDLRLVQCGLMDKSGDQPAAHGERPDFQPGEQGLHQDYSNNTLTSPPRPPQLPETLNVILYYSRVEEAGGSTGVAGFSATGQALIPRTYRY